MAREFKSVHNNNNMDEKNWLRNFFNVTPYTTCLEHALGITIAVIEEYLSHYQFVFYPCPLFKVMNWFR